MGGLGEPHGIEQPPASAGPAETREARRQAASLRTWGYLRLVRMVCVNQSNGSYAPGLFWGRKGKGLQAGRGLEFRGARDKAFPVSALSRKGRFPPSLVSRSTEGHRRSAVSQEPRRPRCPPPPPTLGSRPAAPRRDEGSKWPVRGARCHLETSLIVSTAMRANFGQCIRTQEEDKLLLLFLVFGTGHTAPVGPHVEMKR